MDTMRNAFLQGVFDRAAGMYTSVGPGYFNYFGERLIDLLQMDAEKLNFDQFVFDIVACGLSIQFFTDYKKAVNEIYRVLKPGGKVGISTWKRKESKPGVIARVVPKYLPVNGQNAPPPPVNRPDFGDEQFLEDMLDQAGFKNIKIINERRMFFYKDFEEFWQEQWSHGGRATFEMIEKQGAERLENFKTELFDEFIKEYGQDEIPFDANVLVVIGKKGD